MGEASAVSAFWTHLGRPPQSALDETLERLVSEAEAANGGRRAPPDEFLAHVARHVPEDAELPKHLSSLRAEELYLAFLCSRQDTDAIAAFEAAHSGAVGHVAAKLRLSSSDRDELEQRLRTWLFVPAASGKTGIEGYAGRGSLAGWVRVVAARTAQKMKTEHHREQPLDSDEVSLDPNAQLNAPDRAHEKHRYQTLLVEALRTALSQLSDDDRNLLFAHYAEGKNVTAIAAGEGVHRSTISRRLDDLRDRLLTAARTHLVETRGIKRAECDAIFGWVETRFDVTLSRIFDVR